MNDFVSIPIDSNSWRIALIPIESAQQSILFFFPLPVIPPMTITRLAGTAVGGEELSYKMGKKKSSDIFVKGAR
jgi:hypothetical protein